MTVIRMDPHVMVHVELHTAFAPRRDSKTVAWRVSQVVSRHSYWDRSPTLQR